MTSIGWPPCLHVSPTPPADEAQFVSMIQLDVLFFLRDARAAASYSGAVRVFVTQSGIRHVRFL